MKTSLVSSVLLLVVAIGLVVIIPVRVQAQEPATLQGMLINATEGATVPVDTPVLLHSLSSEGNLISTMETVTEADGNFRFDAMPVSDILSYGVVVNYQGMRYSVVLTPEDLSLSVKLTVYEATQDVSVIKVARQSLVIADIVEAEREVVAVGVLNLVNVSDRTLVPDIENIASPSDISFLRFSLPLQAENFDFQSDLTGGQVIPMGIGFAMTAPIMPGDHSVNYSFTFPYQGDSVAYRDGLLQGAEVYQVLVPQRLGPVQAAPLTLMPEVEVIGSVYQVWEGGAYSAGEAITLELSGLPQPGLLSRMSLAVVNGSFWHVTILVIVGAALLLLLVYGGFRAPRLVPEAGTGVSGLAETHESREAMVQAVAALDQRFHQGQITVPVYQVRRQELVSRILAETGGSPESAC